MKETYRRTAELLLDIAPRVFEETQLAMKGGTAINLFIRDMPRLSVDIDLVYLPKEHAREQALEEIKAALNRIRERLLRLPGVEAGLLAGVSGDDVRLQATRGGERVKVEVNQVFRGTVYPVVRRRLMPAASALFRREVEVSLRPTSSLFTAATIASRPLRAGFPRRPTACCCPQG